MAKRVFIIVLDSFGIGEAPDAYKWGDEGSNTLNAIRRSPYFGCDNLRKAGLFNIDGLSGGVTEPTASYGKCLEASAGKDTTVGHWEIAGLITDKEFPTFPNGFPQEIISEFEAATGRKTLCNKPYSGTEVIKDYGQEHVKTGALIVYTSADSVFQIAAHEDVVPLGELYDCCKKAREILNSYGVGRVIARPFIGKYPYKRTSNRHDYSLAPPKNTMLDVLAKANKSVIAVGKINDIFASRGITESYRTISNEDGMNKAKNLAKEDFDGLCFVNLVDFDAKYGHRNDVDGYAKAIAAFDEWLGSFLPELKKDDMLIITADHGCDPSTPSTDHSREYTPLIVCGQSVKKGVNLGIRSTFADIAATTLEYLGVAKEDVQGTSFLCEITKQGKQ